MGLELSHDPVLIRVNVAVNFFKHVKINRGRLDFHVLYSFLIIYLTAS